MTRSEASADLLIEIGTEELPPHALPKLARTFTHELHAALTKDGFCNTEVPKHLLATPRRIAALLPAVAAMQPERIEEKRGPKVGAPQNALDGFARSLGIAIADDTDDPDTRYGGRLAIRQTARGNYYFAVQTQQGKTLAECLPAIVDTVIARLPTTRPMRWGNSTHSFSRPVRWVVCLHGTTVVPITIYGIAAGRNTRGHRFHSNGAIALSQANRYADTLHNACVAVDYDARRAHIRTCISEKQTALGGDVSIDDALLDEVTALVEWPVVLHGTFDTRFLQLPREVLLSVMTKHQRYFPVIKGHTLLPHFVFVANIESHTPATVITGNERVIAPRLADAEFFYRRDQEISFDDRLLLLKKRTFVDGLGTLYDKSMRLEYLCNHLIRALPKNRLSDNDKETLQNSAKYAKCDLTTEMVGEFPELQGVMSGYYSAREHFSKTHKTETGSYNELHADITNAIRQQYQPLSGKGKLANTQCGQLLAIADKLDTSVGLFALGMQPTGEKDPYALRRAALGMMRTLLVLDCPLSLRTIIDNACAAYRVQGTSLPKTAHAVANALIPFAFDRMRGWYHEQHGITNTVFDAVFAKEKDDIRQFDSRVRALHAFTQTNGYSDALALFRRVKALAETAPQDFYPYKEHLLENNRFARTLLTAVQDAESKTGDATTQLDTLAALKPSVDAFLDNTRIETDDDDQTQAYKFLLGRIFNVFDAYADWHILL